MRYEDIRPIFKRVWDQINDFAPKDSEIEKEVMKRHGFDFQQKSSKKRSREDSDEDNAKKHKLEDDAEKKELRNSMDVVPRDDIAIDVESLATKYPIILFEPNEEDEIWKNQQDYNLISWRLFDSCGIHMLLMHTGISIYMMIKKKYPLTQEMLSRMLSRRLEVDQESEMAFELLRIVSEIMNHTEEEATITEPTMEEYMTTTRDGYGLGAIPTMKAADAKKAINEMAKYSQKWHDEASTRKKGTETSNGLAAMQAQLNNLGREIKKVNEKAATNSAIRNQRALIKALEIQIRQMSKVLQERASGNLPSLTETNPRDHVKSISTNVDADCLSIRCIKFPQYGVSTHQNNNEVFLKQQMAVPFSSCLTDYC
ncbi:hypothetical protein Tco_0698132 [Tanacetum coccineum]